MNTSNYESTSVCPMGNSHDKPGIRSWVQCDGGKRSIALSLSLLIGFLSGCASTYTATAVSEPTAKLAVGQAVAISTPGNGNYGGREYSGSGRTTADVVRSAFAKYSSTTSVIDRCDNLDCLREVAPGARYYVVPEILHWEDRATEWSGIKDKVEIKISVYDSKGENVLASTVLAGKSKWATFGGDHPQDLLPEPINNYVQSLFEGG